MLNDIPTSESTDELIDFNNNPLIGLDCLKLLETRNAIQFKFENSGKEVKINRRSIQKIFKLSSYQNQKEKIENTMHSPAVAEALIEQIQNFKDCLEEKKTIDCHTFVSDEIETMQNNSESIMKNVYENRFDVSQREEWDNKVDQGEIFTRIVMLENESKSGDKVEPEISGEKIDIEVSYENNAVLDNNHEDRKSVRVNSEENLELISDSNVENFESKLESYMEKCNFEERELLTDNQKSQQFENKNIVNLSSSSIDNSEYVDIHVDEIIKYSKNKSLSYDEKINDNINNEQFLKINQTDEEEYKENIKEIILNPEIEMSSASHSIQGEILQFDELKSELPKVCDMENLAEKEMLNSLEIHENLYVDKLEENFLNISEKIEGNIDINEQQINVQPASNEQQEENITERFEMVSESLEKIESANNEVITQEVEMVSDKLEQIEEANNEAITEENKAEEAEIVSDRPEIKKAVDDEIIKEDIEAEEVHIAPDSQEINLFTDEIATEKNKIEEVIVQSESSEKKYINDEIILGENRFLLNSELENINDGQSLEHNKELETVNDDKNTSDVENSLIGSESQQNKSGENAIVLEENFSSVVNEQTTESLPTSCEKEILSKEIEDNKQMAAFQPFDETTPKDDMLNEEKIEIIVSEDPIYLLNEIENVLQVDEDPEINQQNEEGNKDDNLNDISEPTIEIASTIQVDALKIAPLVTDIKEINIKSEENFEQVELVNQGECESQFLQEDDFENPEVNLPQIKDINSEKFETHHENQQENVLELNSEDSQTNILSQEQTIITAITESIVELAVENPTEDFHYDKIEESENEFIEEDQENPIEENNSHKDEEITNQIENEEKFDDEIVIPTNEVNTDMNIKDLQIDSENDHSNNIETNLNPEIEIETIIDEQILIPFEDNYRIPLNDTNKNELFESNYITINLEIPDNRMNFFTEIIDATVPTENIDETRQEADENFEHLKKRLTKQSENYQDEITRYGYEDSKLNDTEKSFENKKLVSMDREYITSFSSNPYNFKSNFLTTKYDEMEHEDNNIPEHYHNEEFLEEEKMRAIENTEADKDELTKKLENDLDIVKIESYTTEFNMQNEIAIEEIKYDEAIDMEESNYTCDIDDVVNYDNIKSPVIKRKGEENEFKFELFPARDTDHLKHTPEQAIDVFDINLTEKKSDFTPGQLIKNSENVEIDDVFTKTPQTFNAQENINSSNKFSESNNEINDTHEQQVYFDYKTNIENEMFLSIDQYKTDLIEDITEDEKIEKIQQIQESARRQYELLTKASSLETIHEVRSVIFNVDTDDEKIKRRRTKEIIIVDDEEEDNIIIDEERPKEKKSFRKNSLTCVSRLSLKTLKDDKLYITTATGNEATTEKKFNLKPLVESKRSSAKLFNTKKWDGKQMQTDVRLKQIGLKIAPIKIPPKPKLIPNSTHTEKAGCFSPKPTRRSTMPFIKEMGSIDLCFVCKGAVVKPKQCKRCQKCVCHVCSFELKDRTKCPDCNCLLVLLPKNGSATTMASNTKKFSLTERKLQGTTSIFGKRDGGRSSALNLKNKLKPDIPANCCNCKDSTIASINCQKCGKSSCVMCLNNSADAGKCLSCKGNFKTRYSTNLGTNPQTLTRRLSQNFKKTPTPMNSGTKVNQKMFHTASTKTFTTACGICKKSTTNKNKCLNCPKLICSLCYGNIEGEKTCTDCHLWSKLKLNSKQRISAPEQKYSTTKNIIRPNSRQLELSNASKNIVGKEEKIVKCLNCKKNKKSCKECLKSICVSCKKDSFEKNRCSECRKKPKGNILQRISKSDSYSQLLFDDACLICKVTPNEKISCNNCLKSICSTCVDAVKQNDNKCPNCNNTSYTVLNLRNNNCDSVINDNICISPEKATLVASPEKEIKNESALIDTLCLICARTPYNNLTCNTCNNEVCFTCTYAMKEQFQCPKCPGILSLKEKKDASNECCETPKKNENGSLVINPESPANALTDNISSPIRQLNLDDSQQKLPRKISSNENYTQKTIDNCLICKGSPIKPKSCTSCYKPVCKMCSYEIEDNKCPGCEAELDLVDGRCERNNKSEEKLNSDITNTKIEYSQITDACLVCKGFPIKPKCCENCHKSVCTICSYELEDPSKCKECKGSYKKMSLRNQSKFFTGTVAPDERKSITDSIHGNGPCCVVCKRPPFKAKICWSCMTAIFCTPCSLNFEDSNRCLNCQGPLNKELVIKPLNTSRFNLHSSGIKYDGQQVKFDY